MVELEQPPTVRLFAESFADEARLRAWLHRAPIGDRIAEALARIGEPA